MTFRFNIDIDGHAASVTITAADGPFTGVIDSAEFGTGAVQGKITGGAIAGTVELDGYHADLAGTIAGRTIAGSIKYGWFFSKDFRGDLVA